MNIMKKSLLSACVILLLAACTSPYAKVPYGELPEIQVGQPLEPIAGFQMSPTHEADVEKIFQRANELTRLINQGSLTKVQAAQYLNQYRRQLVGNNVIDDSVYETYLKSAVDSQAGKITPAQSKQQIQAALNIWQQAWRSMSAETKPKNPAFTNFLMRVMGMSPLH